MICKAEELSDLKLSTLIGWHHCYKYICEISALLVLSWSTVSEMEMLAMKQ